VKKKMVEKRIVYWKRLLNSKGTPQSKKIAKEMVKTYTDFDVYAELNLEF